MIKYSSSNKLNLAVLAQIAGITLLVSGTPLRMVLGIAAFTYGAMLYRRTLQAVREAKPRADA